MITVSDYFKAYKGHPEITPEFEANAETLLKSVNELLDECKLLGWSPQINPATGTYISGQDNGGWRPQACPIGAPRSSHKQARGVDIADADGSLDEIITDPMLKQYGLFREHPQATAGWVHLTDRPPGSWTQNTVQRTFWP